MGILEVELSNLHTRNTYLVRNKLLWKKVSLIATPDPVVCIAVRACFDIYHQCCWVYSGPELDVGGLSSLVLCGCVWCVMGHTVVAVQFQMGDQMSCLESELHR